MMRFFMMMIMFVGPAVFAAGGGEGHHGIDWMGVLQSAVNAGVFFGLIFYLIRKPVGNFFTGRLQGIKDALELAEKSRGEATKRLAEIEDKMKNLDTELAEIEENARADAERERERIQASAEKDVARILAHAEEEIEYRKRLAMQELKNYALDLSFERIQADFEKGVDNKLKSDLLDDLVKKVGTGV